jgi:hypothetical protein
MKQSITWNVVGIVLASLFALITYNDVLITDLGLNDKTLAVLRLVSYIGSGVLAFYNIGQVVAKRKIQ